MDSTEFEAIPAEIVFKYILSLPDHMYRNSFLESAQELFAQGENIHLTKFAEAKDFYKQASKFFLLARKDVHDKQISSALEYLSDVALKRIELIDNSPIRVLTHPSEFLDKSHVHLAGESFQRAEKLKFSNQIEAYASYMEAFHLYMQAASNASDAMHKQSLHFLANTSKNHADCIQYFSPNMSNPSDLSSGNSGIEHFKSRVALGGSRGKVAHLEKIPQPVLVKRSVTDDIVSLECMLSDIGLIDPVIVEAYKAKQSLEKESDTASTPLPGNNNLMSSPLGESFLFLSHHFPSESNFKSSAHREISPSKGALHGKIAYPKPQVDFNHKSSSHLQQKVMSKDTRASNEQKSRESGVIAGLWNGGLFGWNNPLSANENPAPANAAQASRSGNDPPPSVNMNMSSSYIPLHWNVDRSVVGRDTTVEIHANNHMATSMMMSMYSSDIFGGGFGNKAVSAGNLASNEEPHPESVRRLLDSIRRLGDENAKLLTRIEHLTDIEAQNIIIRDQMSKFKKEYSARIGTIQSQFSKKHATTSVGVLDHVTPHPNGHSSASNNSDATSREGVAKGVQSTDSGAGNGTGNGTPSDTMEAQRMKDLERTVRKLVQKLDKAIEDIREKDKLITKYEKTLRASSSSAIPKPPKSPPKPVGPQSASMNPSHSDKGIAGNEDVNGVRSSTSERKQSNHAEYLHKELYATSPRGSLLEGVPQSRVTSVPASATATLKTSLSNSGVLPNQYKFT